MNFATGKQQKQVSFAGNVANQNLHSLATPDMLVITTPKLKAQADRIADFHRQHDGMDVEVVLQDERALGGGRCGVRPSAASRARPGRALGPRDGLQGGLASVET